MTRIEQIEADGICYRLIITDVGVFFYAGELGIGAIAGSVSAG